MVKDMYSRLTAISNRPLLYDVYQYMWDAKETTMLLDSYVSWLGRSKRERGREGERGDGEGECV